jgi:hypothetical protein
VSDIDNSASKKEDKLHPIEHLRLLRETTPLQKVINEIAGRQCIFFYNTSWVFDFSLNSSDQPWSVTKQVYFRNSRRHKCLAFALPYLVIQMKFFDEPKYLRAVVTYGEDVATMIGFMSQFIKQEKGTKVWAEKPGFDWEPWNISALFNHLLNADGRFNEIEFYRYTDAFHVKLKGSWEMINV